MNVSKIDQLLPNKLNKTKNVELTKPTKNNDEFSKLLQDLKGTPKTNDPNYGIKVSGHAQKRIKERNLAVDGNEFFKIREAIDKLKTKGGKDSLLVTKNAAYIIDVQRDKIVTALDKSKMAENVFTNIDSTLIVD